MDRKALQAEIAELKKRHNAVILAHNYVAGEVQDVADFVGDSLELSLKAAKSHAPVMVFCGVSFMAETAKILAPEAKVLLPAPDAACPMAAMAAPADVAAYRKAHPGTTLVAYVNTTGATKAEVDVCCTSANADKIVASLPADQPVMFLPDRNLGNNVARQLNRKLEFWPGCCPIHDRVTAAMIREARKRHPAAKVLLHPECRPEAVAEADAALSTGGMLRFLRETAEKEFIIGTEIGILHRMRLEFPDKTFYPLSEDLCCVDMKKITLENVRDALKNLAPEVVLTREQIEAGRRPIERMLKLS